MTNFWLLNIGAVVVLVLVGLYCLLTQRNMIKLFIGVEVISKGIILALIVSGFDKKNILMAQSLAITIIVVEVSVVAVALALIINIYRHTSSLDVRKLTKLKG